MRMHIAHTLLLLILRIWCRHEFEQCEEVKKSSFDMILYADRIESSPVGVTKFDETEGWSAIICKIQIVFFVHSHSSAIEMIYSLLLFLTKVNLNIKQ